MSKDKERWLDSMGKGRMYLMKCNTQMMYNWVVIVRQ